VNVERKFSPLEKSNVKLTLTIPQADVQSEYQALIKDYCKKIQIPGFRKGKVPQEVLERKFGQGLKSEALSAIIEKAITQVFEDNTLSRQERPLPYTRPELGEMPPPDFDKDMEFSLVYDVLPKVDVGVWKGLSVEAPDAAISDDDINRELEEIRERNAIVLDRDDDAAAQDHDIVTVDYWELDEAGEPLPGGERLDFACTLGTGGNQYDFDDKIIGMKKGQTAEFTKTYPAEPPDAPLAGKTLKMRLTLKSLKEKKLPDLDDDLAQDVDEKYQTLDDLKNSIRARLDTRLKRKLKDITITKILEKIMETTPVILPESMVQTELEGRWRSMAQRFGLTPEKLAEMMGASGKNPQDIQNEWRPAAEKALHSRLIVETLMEQEKLEATEEELEKEIETVAAEINTPVEELQKYYQEHNEREYLKEDVKERKLFDLLLAENTVNPGKKEKYLDIMGNNG
jgi:trigger factor